MIHTKLQDRTLPIYTKGEEICNMVTHIIGGAIGIPVLVLCIIFSSIHKNYYGLLSGIVYGISMIILYTMSAIYHGLSPKLDIAKKVFQILDHCTIFVLIAGSYTPVLLCQLRLIDPIGSYILLLVVWLLAIIGIILNAIDLESFKKISMILYLGIGWCILFKLSTLLEIISFTGFLLLLLGGLSYTIGTIFYKLQDKYKYMHSIWHIFIIIGSLLHSIYILSIM